MCIYSDMINLKFVTKRLFDIFFSIFVSIFAVPVLAIAMLVIKICSPEDSVVFKQKRIGFRCKEFTIFKLRTMINKKDSKGMLLPDEKRLKIWGIIIRKLSIDELLQIVNIFAGQMSWIGPRPLLPREMLVMTKEEQRERQSFLPGITGWEAVNEEKTYSRRLMAEYDLYYVKNWSYKLDVKIFFKTIKKLFVADRSDDVHRAPKLKEEELKTSEIVNEVIK